MANIIQKLVTLSPNFSHYFYDLKSFQSNSEVCSLSKYHCLPFLGNLHKSTHCLEYIHFDLTGHINPPTLHGLEYYFKITNPFLWYEFLYFLRWKSEAFECIQKFHAVVTVLHSWPIKTIVTDGGEKFNSNKFKEFLQSKEITSHITAP